MSILARHPFVVAAVLAVVAVVVAFLVPVPGQDAGGSSAAGTRTERTPATATQDGRPTPSPSMSPAAEEQSATVDGVVRRPISVTGQALPGLSGSGGTRSLRPRVIRLTATSTEPIGVVGYFIPTSRDRSGGTAQGVGRSWSLTTRVYGSPDYAQMFLQAGPSGAAITCTITVDGKVTERRSSSGPYGQLFCQG